MRLERYGRMSSISALIAAAAAVTWAPKSRPGLPEIRESVRHLHAAGHETGVDEEQRAATTRLVRDILARPPRSRGLRKRRA